MPRRDGTGPSGAGAGSGRMRGLYCRPGSGVSGFIIQLIINNWMTIVGFIITTLVPLIGRKLYLENKADNDKIPVLTATPVDRKELSK
ncbi:MAG: hypothetical protein CVV42_06880 [Candidatus Riflebacteria bacterium HGW-Riflebacteria-2]|jgi:hypothetical protein|nr:MAG: hypothetical protein CVV42_06880 [Candidatus Riflebacteria bacterium HGW-Riflebacteria-2]